MLCRQRKLIQKVRAAQLTSNSSSYHYLVAASFASIRPIVSFFFQIELKYDTGTGLFPTYGEISGVNPGFFISCKNQSV